MVKLFVKAVYNSETKDIDFQIADTIVKTSPESFGRMMEYLDMFWKSYCEAKKNGQI